MIDACRVELLERPRKIIALSAIVIWDPKRSRHRLNLLLLLRSECHESSFERPGGATERQN